jgi:hypothetical protein
MIEHQKTVDKIEEKSREVLVERREMRDEIKDLERNYISLR